MKVNRPEINAVDFPTWLWNKDGKPMENTQLPIQNDSVSIGNDKPPVNVLPPRGGGVSGKKDEVENDLHQSVKPVPKKKWTILFYSAADNDLERYMVTDANEIENVGSSNNMNLVMQLDRGKKPSAHSGAWEGARRLHIIKDENTSEIGSPVMEEMGQVNMSDPKTLQNFIEWGVENYPAQHYMLIVSDHGAGWKGAIEDLSHDGWMSTPDFGKALGNAQKNTGKKLDVVGFDACLMGASEVAYEIRDGAQYMVASEDLEGAEGWPYTKILSEKMLKKINTALIMKANLDPKTMAKFLVYSAGKDKKNLPTMSAIDLKKMDQVGAATKEMADAIIATDTTNRDLKSIIRRSEAFGGFKDQYDFAEEVLTSNKVDDNNLKKSAKNVMEAVSNAVLFEEHDHERYPGAHGLTVNLPSFRMSPPPEYKETAFAKDTGWDKALERIDRIDQAGPGQGDVPQIPKFEAVAIASDIFTRALIKTETPVPILMSVMGDMKKLKSFQDHYNLANRIYQTQYIQDEKLKLAAVYTMETLEAAGLAKPPEPQEKEKLN